jgi:hypothetical protein
VGTCNSWNPEAWLCATGKKMSKKYFLASAWGCGTPKANSFQSLARLSKRSLDREFRSQKGIKKG